MATRAPSESVERVDFGYFTLLHVLCRACQVPRIVPGDKVAENERRQSTLQAALEVDAQCPKKERIRQEKIDKFAKKVGNIKLHYMYMYMYYHNPSF